MISISKPQGARQAKDYLSKESYYQQNGVLGQWHGSVLALKYVGLTDSDGIEKKTYACILNGVHPVAGKHLLSNSNSEKRRAGIDITFSAPKSVSLIMELSEGLGEKKFEKRIRTAHEEAVQYAMKKVSSAYAKTRIRKGKGNRETVHSHALWASFQHDTTRETDLGEIDPQLHTHNFMMALTFYEDPLTGKLKPYAMSNEEIYANKMYLGQIYRNALAKNLGELGLDVEVTNVEQGFFEVKGFSTEQLETFSGRRTELLEKLAHSDLKLDNQAKMLDMINAKTKKSKRKIDRATLIAHNQIRMAQVGIDRAFYKQVVSKMNSNLSMPFVNKLNKEDLTKEHLEKSLDLLEEKHSIFDYEEIMKNALKLGFSYRFTLKDYDNALDLLMKDGRLIQLDENVYSTKAIVEAERAVIELIVTGKESQASYSSDDEEVNSFIDSSYDNMTNGQKAMVKCILDTKDPFVVIQGDAGTGKTYAASAVKDFMALHNQSTEVIGLSYTGKAAQSLEEESGITSSTLHRFIYQEEQRDSDVTKRRLILLDEAGMVGSLQMAKLMKIARENQDKVVFIGDTKQFTSIAAGNIFCDMQTYGAKTVYMSETMRQKSKHAKGIVKAVKGRQPEKAMDTLESRGAFIEADKELALEHIAQKYSETYASINPLEDELIIASKNADRMYINERIRKHLGKVGKGEMHTVKESWSQNGVGRYFTKNLEEGMILIPSKVPKTKNGAEYRISSIIDDKHIEIEASNGKSTVIDFYKYSQQCQIYKEVEKEFTVGETIVFNKNVALDKNTKVKNGERVLIEDINNGIIQTSNGKNIDIKEMSFIDYGYAITDFKSQGATTKNVTILADTQMASLSAFYTQVTRAKENITIYTDNKEALFANLKKDTKQHSTLAYTVEGKKIYEKNKIYQMISSNLKGSGAVLAGMNVTGENVAALLNLPESENEESVSTLDALVNKLDMVIQKIDMHISSRGKKVDLELEKQKSSPAITKSLLFNASTAETKQPSVCVAMNF